jgi:hypothetical protein
MLAHVLAGPHWPDTAGQLPVDGVGVVGGVGVGPKQLFVILTSAQFQNCSGKAPPTLPSRGSN